MTYHQEEHSNEEHKAKPQAFSRAAVLESASLHAALEPIELKHVTSQVFTTVCAIMSLHAWPVNR